MTAWLQVSLVLLAYALGSISFALLLTRAVKGIDLRTVGSGNLGATNAGRVLGRKWAVVIYVLDFLKGLLPVVVVRRALGDPALFDTPVPLALAAGAAAFAGHCWPIWHGLRGGKGVATTSGLLLALSWPTFLLSAGVFAVTVLLSRMISLGSVLAGVSLAPAYAGLESGRAQTPAGQVEMGVLAAIALVVIWRHRANLRRILQGTESRIGKKST